MFLIDDSALATAAADSVASRLVLSRDQVPAEVSRKRLRVIVSPTSGMSFSKAVAHDDAADAVAAVGLDIQVTVTTSHKWGALVNNSNRFLNRLILFLGGVVSILVATAAIMLALRPPWTMQPVRSTFDKLLHIFSGWNIETTPHAVPGLLVAISAGTLVLAGLMLWFLLSRPQSTPNTLGSSRFAHDEVTVSEATAAQFLTDPLTDRADVISVQCRSAHLHRDPALAVPFRARRPAHANRASR